MIKKAPSIKKSSTSTKVKSLKTTEPKMLKEIIDNSRIGIFRTTVDGEVLFCNSALISILGYKSFSEISKIDLARDLYVNPTDRNRLINKLKKTGSIEKKELLLLTKNKKRIPVLFSVHAKSNKKGIIDYIDGFIEDLSVLKQNEKRINKVNEHLKILNSINNSLSKTPNLDDLLDKCMKVILSHFTEKIGGVFYFAQDGWLVPESFYPEQSSHRYFPIKIGPSGDYAKYSLLVYSTKKAFIVSNTHDKSFLKKYPQFKKKHAHSFAIFPVVSGDEILGVINIYCDEANFFDSDKAELFKRIVAQFSVYVLNAGIYLKTNQKIEDARKKFEEINLSYKIANRLAVHIDFDKIINECFSILKEQKFSSAKIYLAAEDGKTLDLLSYYCAIDEPLPGKKIENGKLFSGLAAVNKTPVIINDTHNPDALRIDPDLKERARHSFAALPIIFGNKCLGTITLSSSEINFFKKSVVSLCDAISCQLSFVLNNAVQHSQMLKKNNELIQLYNTINRLSKHLELKNIFNETFEIFKEMGFVSGKIYKISADKEYIELVAHYYDRTGPILERIKIGERYSGVAAEKLIPVIVNDTHDEKVIADYPEYRNLSRHSFASFPLEYNEKCVGVLNLAHLECNKFTPEIVNLCSNIAKQLALLLNNSEIHEKTIKRYNEVTLLYDITKRLSAYISLNEIISECFRFFRELYFTDGKVFLNKNDNLDLFALYSNSKVIPGVPKEISAGKYFSTIAFDTGNPVVINSTHSEEMCRTWPEMKNFKEFSFAVFPIIYGDKRQGVLNLASDEPNYFDEFTINLIVNITRHLGVLINNSQLYEKVIKKNQHLKLLNELSQELNKNTNLYESAQIIVKKLEEMYDYDGFYIDLYDRKNGTMSNVINIDIIDGEKKSFKGEQNRFVSSPLILEIIDSKKPVLLLRENENEKIFNLTPFGDTKRRALSLMYSPLSTEDEILGIIAVHSYKKNAFNNDDLTLLTGVANYISVIIRNILLYKHLSDSENRYRILIENAPEAIFSFDTNGIFIAANSKTFEFLNSSEQELLGKPVISFLPEEVKNYFLSKFKGALDKKIPLSFELKMHGGRYFENTIVPIIEEENKLEYFVGISRDITTHKEAEENNNQIQLRLSENKKHEFVVSMTRNIAHVFNNVLVNVLSRSSFAKTLVEKESVIYPHLEKIEVSSKRVSELVKQLLIFAQSGNYLIEALDLNKIIQFFFYSKKRQIKLDVDFQLSLSENNPFVISNRDQIIVMLDKLFTNSIEAVGDKGKITLSTGIVKINEQKLLGSQKIESGTYGIFSVADNGCGIREDIKNRFFEPFNTTKEYGRGLGLPSVFGIVMNMNGFLNIVSEADKGTEVEIYLPLA